MSKYAGIINIIDDQGEVVYERELSQEAIITELLLSAPKRVEADDKPPVIIEPEVLTRTHVRPPVVTEEPPAAPPRVKGQKLCKACGEPGHMQKTCPKQRVPNVTPPPSAKAERAAQEELTSPEFMETAPPGSHEVVNMTPMSKAQFEDLKELQLDEKSAEDISMEIGWDNLDDVEVALKSNSYFAYIFDRKKVLAKKMRKG